MKAAALKPVQKGVIKKMRFEFKYKKCAEALYSALCQDAFYRTLEKSIEGPGPSKEAMVKYMDFSMVEGHQSGVLYMPENLEYGASIWSKPLAWELDKIKQSEKKAFLLDALGRNALNTYQSIVDFMGSRAAPFIGDDYWYLSIIGILPRFQGQGLGPGLVRDVLTTTDSLNIATYLETFTPRNIGFYKKLGYQEIDSFFEPTTQARYWIMIREPQ